MRKIYLLLILAFIVSPNAAFAAAQTKQAKPESNAQRQASKSIPGVPALVLGVAWYPEHWEEARWETDLTLMQAAGINMVRVGEFAWSRMEPQDGQFDFGWLDRAIALAAKRGMKIVVGTPTAAPPAWLTQKYPETLATWEDGTRATHGNRGQYRITSAKYLELARRLAAEMAKRYGNNPDVIGWQIDNEYGPVSYDAESRQQFQSFLKSRYRTLAALNKAWSTDYWSQTYDNWEQIPIPVGYHNPGLMLEWKRFGSEMFRNYQHNQIEAIRAHADPRQFITHNFMGFYGGFDHYLVAQELNFASWDNYVGTGHLDPVRKGAAHDLTRGFKRKSFWVMETQPGSVNWADVNNMLDRGEVRRMAWEAIGHGADAVAYWQWRNALGGQEQYHGSLLGADGKPRPVYDEVAELGREFAKIADAIKGTSPAPQTAILYDYDSRWAIEFQKHNKDFDPNTHLQTYYRPLRQLTQDIDIVHPTAPLSHYKLVVAPALNVLPDSTEQQLVEYVKAGGHLVIGARTGMKDEHNALKPSLQPGKLLSNLLGGEVAEFFALEKNVPVSGALGSGEAKTWAEMLRTSAPDVEVLLKFGKSNGWLDGQPAVISRKLGSGRVTYVGGQFDESIMAGLSKWMVEDAGVKPALGPVPSGVEVCRRVSHDKELFILINHSPEAQKISLPAPMRELLKGSEPAALLTIPANDVVVLVPAGK
ncbi:MAG TPA: beta-galactosidase [Clostridia bacterium]|nr:beta-galactosidase [Clostridia bacterium]